MRVIQWWSVQLHAYWSPSASKLSTQKGMCHTKMKGLYKMYTSFKEDNGSADRCSTKKQGCDIIMLLVFSQGKWLCTTGANTLCSS